MKRIGRLMFRADRMLAVNGEDRTHYVKIYRDATKRRGFLVIVDKRVGYAFNMRIVKPSKALKKVGANTDEQPHAGVL